MRKRNYRRPLAALLALLLLFALSGSFTAMADRKSELEAKLEQLEKYLK